MREISSTAGAGRGTHDDSAVAETIAASCTADHDQYVCCLLSFSMESHGAGTPPLFRFELSAARQHNLLYWQSETTLNGILKN